MIVIDLIYIIFFPLWNKRFSFHDCKFYDFKKLSNNEFDVINIYKNFLEQ